MRKVLRTAIAACLLGFTGLILLNWLWFKTHPTTLRPGGWIPEHLWVYLDGNRIMLDYCPSTPAQSVARRSQHVVALTFFYCSIDRAARYDTVNGWRQELSETRLMISYWLLVVPLATTALFLERTWIAQIVKGRGPDAARHVIHAFTKRVRITTSVFLIFWILSYLFPLILPLPGIGALVSAEGRLGLEVRDSDVFVFRGLQYSLLMGGSIAYVLVRAKRLALGRTYRAEHCVKCGYDLRATPDRCPECGLVVGTTSG